jgi:O-antigen ligase
MRKLFSLIEQGFTVFSLMIYSGGFLSLIVSGGSSEGEAAFLEKRDSPIALIVFQLIYIVTFALLILRWKKVLYILRQDKFIWTLVAYATASILWSFDPKMTFIRSVALIGTSMFGLYFATRYSIKEQLQLLGGAFGLVITLSFLSALLLPKYGIMSGIHAGAWRGIYNHKNVLGKMMVLSTFIFLLLATGSSSKRLYFWGGMSASLVLLILSKSSSASISFLVLLTIYLILRTLRWRYDLMLPVLLAVLILSSSLILWLTNHSDALLSAMGKDPTLTGRVDFWILILENIQKHFWLGYGYGGFWQESNSDATLIRYAVAWDVPNSHNGLLEVWIDLGIIGVAIFSLGFCITSLRALYLLRISQTSTYIWPSLFVANMAIANLTEVSLMVRNDLFWVLYITVVFSVLAPPAEKAETRIMLFKQIQAVKLK